MKHQNNLQSFGKNNKGSAILSVVVAMMFVVALGSALLYAAYTGFSIKMTEREDRKNFYSADKAMDEIRAGIQDAVSKALGEAYTETLVEYGRSNVSGSGAQSQFAATFIDKLSTATDKNNQLLFTAEPPLGGGNNTIDGYHPQNLIGFTSAEAGTLTIGLNRNFNIDASKIGEISSKSATDGTQHAFVMEDLSIKYVAKGFETNLTTDITIQIPDFFAKALIPASVNNCAIVTNGSLSSQGDHTVKGTIYTGKDTNSGKGVDISNGGKLTQTNGDLFSKGNVSLSGNSSFTFGEVGKSNELWAAGINVGSKDITTNTGGGTANISGKAYVADDLTIDGPKGSKSSVTLSGEYFGFGGGATHSESSAIIVNALGSKLDISGLSKLTLAGISFVDIAGVDFYDNSNMSNPSPNQSPIPMGQSISAKSDQLAYLLPAECIKNYPSNPCVFNDRTKVAAPILEKNTTLWTVDGKPKKLSDYINNDMGIAKTLYKNLDGPEGPVLAYVFMDFKDKADANQYFKDYFSAKPGNISQYLNLYMNLSDRNPEGTIVAAGNTFYNDTAKQTPDKLTLVPAASTVWTTGAQNQFDKIPKPYTDFVNVKAVEHLEKNTTLEFKDKDNNVVAVVTNKSSYAYTSTTAKNTVRLIISGGGINVQKPFTGMLLAAGNIQLNANVTAEPLNQDILSATC
ncbi:MAG: hypothetical protein RSD32_04165, partial [Oscillospiraceae bacterium]